MSGTRGDRGFQALLVAVAGSYVVLLGLLLAADLIYLGQRGGVVAPVVEALRDPAIRASVVLTLASCSISAALSVVVAVPTAYLLARRSFRGKAWVEAALDIPIALPPLVVGLSLLILFQLPPFREASGWFVYQVPGVVLAQFVVAAAFAVRAMRAAFDQTDERCENVALTLGCTRWQAFRRVVVPEVRKGMVTAATLAWARSLGEFGPLLIFAGATRFKTEVLSTTVFLELSVGELEAAVAVSLIMIAASVVALTVARWAGRGRRYE